MAKTALYQAVRFASARQGTSSISTTPFGLRTRPVGKSTGDKEKAPRRGETERLTRVTSAFPPDAPDIPLVAKKLRSHFASGNAERLRGKLLTLEAQTLNDGSQGMSLLLARFGFEPCEKTYCSWGATCVVSENGKPLCQCPTDCPSTSEPVCGSDNVTYTNYCHLRKTSCLERKTTRVKNQGVCENGESPIRRDWDGNISKQNKIDNLARDLKSKLPHPIVISLLGYSRVAESLRGERINLAHVP
ncbi:hypothetical protein K0M31_003625 [Melipona bicolor]|uniref:Kazal-like domain-containing protein n=1 Tax=Melipona bicolor TaxID=60889 RepID=A0AA40KGQ5_9HYME|nr:hypothetical protein K0M31_013012 [Melipona bicolor]KAK1128140.1 hypothetical protein K0M31_003625 [Melipona bicolor]